MPIRADRMSLYPGGSTRSPEWQAIRARIRQRAGNRCEGCGVDNHDLGGRLPSGTFLKARPTGDNGLRITWPRPGEEAWCGGDAEPIRLHVIRIVCTVAHVDGDEKNNAEGNLRFWCQQCHNRHDAKQRAANAAETRRKARAAGDLFDKGRKTP